jgi:hypothetical protein
MEPVQRWPFGPPFAVAVSGSTVYSGSGSGLLIIDVSNPAAPQQLGHVVLPEMVVDIAVSGDYAYITDEPYGLYVADISDPTQPVLAGSVAPSGDSRGVFVADGYAYVTDYWAGLHVIDVGVPSAPTAVGYCNIGPQGSLGAIDVVVYGGRAYVAHDIFGLVVIDVTSPSSPTLVGEYTTPEDPENIALSDGAIYLAEGNGGVEVFVDCSLWIFNDGFESGGTTAWSGIVP